LYGIWLCVNGVWELVTVSDQIVCLNELSGPAFSKANGNELWVLLLEKAYAKVYGSFSKIVNGMSGKAINDLTGAPYETLDLTTKDKALEYLCYGKKNNFLMTCSSKSKEEG